MKLLPTLLSPLLLVGCVSTAQVAPPPAAVATESATVVASPALFTAEQLEQLLGPIALYPDALIALILPASTNSSEIVLAARFLQSGGLPGQAELQPWEDSVRALAHYPQVIRWMDENLAWTKQLGDAFAAQPADVMNAIQRLRARARAAGTLSDTPQQRVVYEGDTILIVPADPNIIYVPYYDPQVVYVPTTTSYVHTRGPFFGFSTGLATGWWLSYGLDWPSRRVWCVTPSHRERYWREHHHHWNHHFRRPPAHFGNDVHVWRPRMDRHHDGSHRHHPRSGPRGGIVQPDHRWRDRNHDDRQPPRTNAPREHDRDHNRGPAGNWTHRRPDRVEARTEMPNFAPAAISNPVPPAVQPPVHIGDGRRDGDARHRRVDRPEFGNRQHGRGRGELAPPPTEHPRPAPPPTVPLAPDFNRNRVGAPTYGPPSAPAARPHVSEPRGRSHAQPAPQPVVIAPPSTPAAAPPPSSSRESGDSHSHGRGEDRRRPPIIRAP